MITLAAFDMAGTTVDEHGVVYDALADAVASAGFAVPDAALQAWMGAEKRSAIEALIRLDGGEPSGALLDRTFAAFEQALAERYRVTPPVALPGVEALFVDLHRQGIKIALTTGFSRDVTTAILDQLGWTPHVVDAVVSSDEVAAGRPAPYLIHRAMERVGAYDVAEVLVAGDTVRDLEAGRNAGVALNVGVLTGKLGRQELEAVPHSYVLDSATEILELPELTRKPATVVV